MERFQSFLGGLIFSVIGVAGIIKVSPWFLIALGIGIWGFVEAFEDKGHDVLVKQRK